MKKSEKFPRISTDDKLVGSDQKQSIRVLLLKTKKVGCSEQVEKKVIFASLKTANLLEPFLETLLGKFGLSTANNKLGC